MLQRVTALAWFRNRIWAASYGTGLFVLKGQQWQPWMPEAIPRFLTCLSADSQRLWFGTWMEGKIGYLDTDLHPHFISLPKLTTPRFVYRNSCLASEDSSVWLGTDGYLLNYDTQENDWQLILAVGSVNSIQRMASLLWVGTDETLMVLEKKRNVPCSLRIVINQMRVSSLATDGDTLWLGGQLKEEGCIGQYVVSERRFVPVRVPIKGWINDITPMKNHLFFSVGSGSRSFDYGEEFPHGGVFIYNKRSRQWHRVKFISLTDVWCLLKVGQILYIGGYAGVQRIRV